MIKQAIEVELHLNMNRKEGSADRGKEGNQDKFLHGDCLWWTENQSDLMVAVAVLSESGPEKLPLIMLSLWDTEPTINLHTH
jgi:hypothetical protein